MTTVLSVGHVCDPVIYSFIYKAILLGPYGVFTKARRYADSLRPVTALSWRHRTRRISHHVCGHHGVVLRGDNAVTALSRRHGIN